MSLQPIACLISAARFALLARHPWSFQGPTVQEKTVENQRTLVKHGETCSRKILRTD